MRNKYELLGVVSISQEEFTNVPGIHSYLHFIIRTQFNSPRIVVPTPIPTPDDICIIRGAIDYSSKFHARDIINYDSNYIPVDKRLMDIFNQVIVQNTEGIFIADAEQIHRHFLNIRNALGKIGRERAEEYARKNNCTLSNIRAIIKERYSGTNPPLLSETRPFHLKRGD